MIPSVRPADSGLSNALRPIAKRSNDMTVVHDRLVEAPERGESKLSGYNEDNFISSITSPAVRFNGLKSSSWRTVEEADDPGREPAG